MLHLNNADKTFFIYIIQLLSQYPENCPDNLTIVAKLQHPKQ